MLLQGVAETVNQMDYAMLLWLAESHEIRGTFAQRVIRHRQPDGVLLTSVTDDDPLFEYLLARNRRFVMVESPPRMNDRVSYVTVDNVHAAETAVNHLIEIGRRRIATITGQINIRDASERLTGYMNALQTAGLPIDERLIAYGRFDREHGYRAMRELLQYEPDAVFAGGDTAAIGAISALQEAGVRVPEDIAVIGFDDLDVAVQANLTTIHHSVQTVGSTAAHLLIDILEGRLEHPHHIVLPTELVIRGSTVRV